MLDLPRRRDHALHTSGLRSVFFDHCASQQWFSTRDTGVPAEAPRLEPRARHETPNVTLSFSELKYMFECPYQFKLRFLYGFNPPLHEALGYGKGLHDALSELHKRALAGDIVGSDEVEDLVDRHMHAPYAYPALRQTASIACRNLSESKITRPQWHTRPTISNGNRTVRGLTMQQSEIRWKPECGRHDH
ncbi:MAG: PD-(D/E)XK nuclease family protein [Solirubrobacteraceae bacterium]